MTVMPPTIPSFPGPLPTPLAVHTVPVVDTLLFVKFPLLLDASSVNLGFLLQTNTLREAPAGQF